MTPNAKIRTIQDFKKCFFFFKIKARGPMFGFNILLIKKVKHKFCQFLSVNQTLSIKKTTKVYKTLESLWILFCLTLLFVCFAKETNTFIHL